MRLFNVPSYTKKPAMGITTSLGIGAEALSAAMSANRLTYPYLFKRSDSAPEENRDPVGLQRRSVNGSFARLRTWINPRDATTRANPASNLLTGINAYGP